MRDFIIIPTFNERRNIERLIPAIFNLYPEINNLIVDDNSPDGTADVVTTLKNRYPNLHLYSRPAKLGLATAYTQTMQNLLHEEKDIRSITTMDADFSHDPAIIKEMLKEISQHDLVIGSRYVDGGNVKNWNLQRRLLSRGGNSYARAVIGLPIQDLTTGFQCFRTELLKKYNFSTIKSTGYAFLMEMKAIAHTLGARIKEIPITFTDRIEGKSKLSNRIIYEGIIAPWKIRRSNREYIHRPQANLV